MVRSIPGLYPQEAGSTLHRSRQPKRSPDFAKCPSRNKNFGLGDDGEMERSEWLENKVGAGEQDMAAEHAGCERGGGEDDSQTTGWMLLLADLEDKERESSV